MIFLGLGGTGCSKRTCGSVGLPETAAAVNIIIAAAVEDIVIFIVMVVRRIVGVSFVGYLRMRSVEHGMDCVVSICYNRSSMG